jgi:hypothetical protein
MWLEEEEPREVEVTEAAAGGDGSDRLTFFCGGGCWFWDGFCASDGKRDDSSRSEPAASHRISMPFCSVMFSRTGVSVRWC